MKQKWLIRFSLLISFCLLSGFATLDGDRTKWPFNPSYQLLNQYLADGSDTTAIQTSFQTWANIPNISLNLTQTNSNPNITVDFLSQWPAEVGESAAGVTYTYRQNGQISQAEIHINTQNFQWSTQTPTPQGFTDIEGVVTHEIGHALGLTHSFHRVATMYWSGGDIELRDLDQDDIQGLQFLYGNFRSGLMCDTCQSNDDCRDGTCIDFGEQRYFCGQSCQNACPEHSSCYMLSDGSTSCLPDILACSDMATNVSQIGDYCFGGAQCAMNSTCFPTDQDASCVALNQGQYGQECQFDAFCASQLCMPLDDQYYVCSSPCEPSQNNCPQGDECYAINQNGLTGVCIPGGNQQEGANCGDVQHRCANGLICLQDRNQNTCRFQCDAFGACPSDLQCTPEYISSLFGGGSIGWVCRNQGSGVSLGSSCEMNYCDAGLYCEQGSKTCVMPCQNDQDCTTQESCILLNIGMGICKTKEQPNTQDMQVTPDPIAGTQAGTQTNPQAGTQTNPQAGTQTNPQAGTDTQVSLLGTKKNEGCQQQNNPQALWLLLLLFVVQRFRKSTILLICLSCTSAFALVQEPKPLIEWIKKSDMIVLATVSNQTAHTMNPSPTISTINPKHTPIFTTSELQVDTCMKSPKDQCPTSFHLRQIGGRLGNTEMLVTGSQILTLNQQVILILKKSQNPAEPYTYFLIDLIQGIQPKEQLKAISEMINP